MDYIGHESVPYFKECAEVVAAEGFVLVDLQLSKKNAANYVSAVIAAQDASKDIALSDCAKVHRALQPKLISLMGVDEDGVYMEVCSPGVERNIKNAAEFACFTGRDIRVWDKTVQDWVRGNIASSDESALTLKKEDGTEAVIAYVDIAKAKFIHNLREA